MTLFVICEFKSASKKGLHLWSRALFFASGGSWSYHMVCNCLTKGAWENFETHQNWVVIYLNWLEALENHQYMSMGHHTKWIPNFLCIIEICLQISRFCVLLIMPISHGAWNDSLEFDRHLMQAQRQGEMKYPRWSAVKLYGKVDPFWHREWSIFI